LFAAFLSVTLKRATVQNNVMTINQTEAVDIAILGGGLAGLSLAVRLTAPEFSHLRVMVIEPRSVATFAVRDRTWCYWNTWGKENAQDSHHPFAPAVHHRYAGVAVRGMSRTTHFLPSRYEYEVLPSDAFFSCAEKIINQSSNVRLYCSVSANNVRKSAPDIEIDTSIGTIHAHLVFDSRPPPASVTLENKSTLPAFWQHFEGWEVEAMRPVFTPDRAMLMDFAVPQTPHQTQQQTPSNGVHFMYVLPISTTRALIEDTWFTPQTRMNAPDYQKPDYAAEINAYLAREFGLMPDEFKIIYRESAVLPMDVGIQQSAASQIVPIGVAGGMARASSGYAFADTQRATASIANTLATLLNADPSKRFLSQPIQFAAWRAPRLNWMDGIFLSVMATHPERAPQIFENLFRRVSPDRLIRFLGGVPTSMDLLHVIAACPKIPFIVAAMKGKLK
jgi:lycopene beta-cyclase